MRIACLSSDIAHLLADLAPKHTPLSPSCPEPVAGVRKRGRHISSSPYPCTCMAPQQPVRPDPDHRQLGRYHSITRPHSPNFRPQSCPLRSSSPLSPVEWDDISISLRTQDCPESSGDMPSPPSAPDPLFSWRLRPSGAASSSSRSSQRPQARPRQRHRPGVRLENMEGRRDAESLGRDLNVSSLYPQLSPYDDQFRSYSAPDHLENSYRSISHPNTPAFNNQVRSDVDEPSLFLNARVPTYPPSTRRRGQSTANAAETTFSDDDEFHLFAEATAGLGPVQAFARAGSSSSSYGTNEPGDRRRNSIGSQYLSSPLEQTPTTMAALQQLAQMPQSSQPSSRNRQSQYSGVEPWLQSSHRGQGYNSCDEEEFNDEELPDYAASQAQAQAVQRIEATRRAQELQRRWQQSRYGEG